jgi:uncharacterized membrane protein
MESRAKFGGHALHRMLIVFPLGLLATAVIFDIAFLVTDRHGLASAAGYMIGAGIIGGLLAALFGLMDFRAIRSGTRAKRVGLLHGLGNVLVLALFAVSWFLRVMTGDWNPSWIALAFSFGGIIVALGTAWLGGELTERLGIAVDDGSNENAPSSLRGPARGGRRPMARPTEQPGPAPGP